MLTARVQQIKVVGDEVGISSDDMSKAEQALTGIGISIRGQNGSLRDMDSVLQDVNTKWNTLSDQQKSEVAEGVAGNRYRTTFLSLMKSMTTEQNLYNDAMNSSGTLEEANEKRAESFQGKLNTLKTTFNQLSATMINSKLLSGGIDIATGTLGGINTLATKLGTIPTIITTVVGALTILNSKFRENVNLMSGSIIPGYTQFTNYLNNLRTNLANSVSQQEKNIAVSREFMSASQQAGMSTRGMATELVGMEAKLLATRAGMVACTIATIALQTALSMGVSLLASMAITGLMNLANSSENAKQKIDELSSSIKEEGNSISQAEDLLSKKTDLENQISKTSEGTQQNTELKKQLLDVERQISDVLPQSTSGFDSEGKAISANTDLIRAQIQAKKDKLAVDAQELISNAKDVDGLMKKIELTEKQLDAVKLAQKQGKSSVAIPVSLDSDATQNIGVDPKYISDVEKSLTEYKSTISNVRLAILQLKEAGKSDSEIKSMFPSVDISAINSFTDSIGNSTTKTKENTNAKADNAKNTKVLADATRELQQSSDNKISSDTIDKLNKEYPDLGINAENAKDKVEELNKTVSAGDSSSVEKATEDYNTATQAIAQAQTFLDKLNKAHEVTPALVGQLEKKYGDLGTSINSVASLQDYLSSKIQEEQESQEQALMIMKGDDEAYYSEKVANNQAYQDQINNFLNSFVENSQGAYDIDLNNYHSLNQMKAGAMDTLQSAVDSFMSQFVNTSAEGYKVDYANFTTLINAKKEAMKAIAGSLADFWDESSQEFGAEGYGGGTYLPDNASDETYKAYEDKINKIAGIRDKVKDAESKLDGIYAGGGLNFQGFSGGSGGGVSDFSGTGGGSGSKGKSSGSSGSGKSQEEKDAEKAQKEADEWIKKINDLNSEVKPDMYYDENNAITLLDNSMTSLKTSEEGLTGVDLINAKQKEIDIMNKQIDAYKHLQEMQGYEKDHIGSILSNYGILTDSTGKLTNAQEKLAEAQQKANSMSGSTEDDYNAKKDAIEQVKTLNEYITKYNTLVNDTIPKTIDKWEQLANAIKKVNQETLSNFRDTLAKNILKQTQDKVDKLKEEAQKAQDTAKKALEDEKEAKLAQWDQQIKEKQAELDALNDESADNEAKLKKLQTELSEWQRDDSTEAQGKIQNLNTQIADLQKTIKKDNIQKDIDSLNKQKQTDSDDYDKQLKDLDDANKKQEEADEKKYKKMLEEKKAYNEADKLITSNNQKAILKILNDNAENYKDVGTLLGKNFSDAFKSQLDEAQKALDSLKDIKIDKGSSGGGSSSSHYQNTTSSGTNYTDIGTGIISDKPITGSDLSEINNSSSGKSSSSSSSSGSSKSSSSSNSSSSSGTKYVGGKTSDGQSFYFASYETGGRTPDDIDSNGKIGVLHASEKILNKDDTVKFDDSMDKIDKLYYYFKNSNSILSQQLTTLNNYSTPNISSLTDFNKIASSITNNNNTDNSKINNLEINNTYQVENKTDFDTKLLIKNQDKQLRDTLRKYGILKR